jgi:hypothetical protein
MRRLRQGLILIITAPAILSGLLCGLIVRIWLLWKAAFFEAMEVALNEPH